MSSKIANGSYDKDVLIVDSPKRISELAFISEVNYNNNNGCFDDIYLSDTRTLSEFRVSKDYFSHFPERRLKPGTRVRVTYAASSARSSRSDYRDITKIEYVFQTNPDEYPDEMMANISLLECLYRRDVKESVPPSKFFWKFSDDHEAEVSYKEQIPIRTGADTKKNYKNSLFRKDDIAILRRIDANGVASSPAHVRISSAIYKSDFTKILFRVDPKYLMKRWSIVSYKELQFGKYTLEPTNLLWYLADFTRKLMEDYFYIQRRIVPNRIQSKIIQALLPSETSNLRKRSLLFKESDQDYLNSSLTKKQDQAIKAIVERKPIVVVDGATKTGKTEVTLYAITRLLRDGIKKDECLFFTSSSFYLDGTYKNIKNSILFSDVCIGRSIRVLNLLGVHFAEQNMEDSLNHVVDKLLRDRRLSMEDLKILEDGKNVFNSKLAAQYQFNADDRDHRMNDLVEELEWELDDLALGTDAFSSSNAKFKRKSASQFITSAELEALQNTLVVIFKYYKPQLVVIDRLTLIAVLPVVRGLITHLYVESAGNVPLFDIIAAVSESTNLEQLVVVGDSAQCPTHRRIRLSKIPKYFQSVLNGINSNSDVVTKIQMNKTFCLNSGITQIMKQVFYPRQQLSAESKKDPIKAIVRNRDFPIMFYEMRGRDEWVFPTTRRNLSQAKLACFIADEILEKEDVTVAILCYYTAEAAVIRARYNGKLPNNLIVSTVDSFCQKKSDVAIIVTTRTVDCIKPSYYEIFSGGHQYLKRIPLTRSECRKNLYLDNYKFVLDKQRLTTAISRGEKTCIIIGNSELLRENHYWNSLIRIIRENGNFVREPPFLPSKYESYNIVQYNPSMEYNDDEAYINKEDIGCVDLDDEPEDDVEVIKLIKKPRYHEAEIISF